MSHVIEITDDEYESLRRAAERQGRTPEDLLSALIADGTRDQQVHDDLDAFFRSLGASDEVIRESQRLFDLEEGEAQAEQGKPGVVGNADQ